MGGSVAVCCTRSIERLWLYQSSPLTCTASTLVGGDSTGSSRFLCCGSRGRLGPLSETVSAAASSRERRFPAMLRADYVRRRSVAFWPGPLSGDPTRRSIPASPPSSSSFASPVFHSRLCGRTLWHPGTLPPTESLLQVVLGSTWCLSRNNLKRRRKGRRNRGGI